MDLTRPLAALLLLSVAGTAAPQEANVPEAPPRLTLDLGPSLATSGGLLLVAGLISKEQAAITPRACRWCEPGPVDRWARDTLRWSDPTKASQASDLLQVAVPLGAGLTLAILAVREGGGGREATEDVLAMTEAVAVATTLTTVAKVATARLRPEPWATGATPNVNDLHSFWSGHAATAFSAAAAATQVARLRGRPAWRWLAAVSLVGAAAVGYLRVAGDQHWLSDVLTGAAVGTASGLGVPALVLRPAGGAAPPVTLAPAPGGLALLF